MQVCMLGDVQEFIRPQWPLSEEKVIHKHRVIRQEGVLR